jgi:glycosyltransferase 2 family protein
MRLRGPRLETEGTSSMRRGKLAVGAVGFVVLTAAVFWYQFSRLDVHATQPEWDDLRWSYLVLLLCCLPIESVTCAVRTWLMTRILEPRVTLWTCLKAEWANVAISTLTPTQSWGGPGQICVLSRGGASVGTSLTIMLLSCVATLVALLGLALYSVVVASTDGAWPLFLTVVWSFVGIGVAMAFVAIWPGLFQVALGALPSRLAAKLVDLVSTYRADMSSFLRQGKATFACVCLLSLPFPIARAVIAYLCLCFLGIEASDLRHIFEAQLLLILFEFFAPSPGGAGVMEVASLAVMGTLVPAGYAPFYNLLWRASILYLPAFTGFVCLALAVFQDTRRSTRSTAGPDRIRGRSDEAGVVRPRLMRWRDEKGRTAG